MAHFKTGWLQKEQVLDVKVGGSAPLHVGDMVKLDTDTITKTELLEEADYIIAQSDMTMERGHAAIEKGDYRYSDTVAVSSTPKKVAVFFILDESDILLD